MGHWRRSVENLWIMRKVFFYLLFMVLILPSVGLTSLRGLLQLFIDSSQADHEKPSNSTLKWNCIFLPDNGAFFVNYVVTSALVGTALEFMRFSELFMYAFRLLFARSMAETPSVRAANLYEFPFGFNYGWMLLIFALTVAYGVVCPLITPFGLFYLLMKHGVDRYNLYYAYKRSKISKNIHATAVNCVIVSLLIQQLILLFFNLIRGQTSGSSLLSPRAIFSITMFTIFLLLFVAQVFFHIFKGFSPIQYSYQSSSNSPSNSQPASSMGSSGVPTPREGMSSTDIDFDTMANSNNNDRGGGHDSSSTEDGNSGGQRPFIGFMHNNPEDPDFIEAASPAAFDLQRRGLPQNGNNVANNSRRHQRRRGRLQYLPNVLKDSHDRELLATRGAGGLHPGGGAGSSRLIASDSATFATHEAAGAVTSQPRGSPSHAGPYGATDKSS